MLSQRTESSPKNSQRSYTKSLIQKIENPEQSVVKVNDFHLPHPDEEELEDGKSDQNVD